MANKQTKVGSVARKAGHMYFVDGSGAVMEMPRGGGKRTKVATITRKPKMMYFINGQGDVMETAMASRKKSA